MLGASVPVLQHGSGSQAVTYLAAGGPVKGGPTPLESLSNHPQPGRAAFN
jgi:hypothetical protein